MGRTVRHQDRQTLRHNPRLGLCILSALYIMCVEVLQDSIEVMCCEESSSFDLGKGTNGTMAVERRSSPSRSQTFLKDCNHLSTNSLTFSVCRYSHRSQPVLRAWFLTDWLAVGPLGPCFPCYCCSTCVQSTARTRKGTTVLSDSKF